MAKRPIRWWPVPACLFIAHTVAMAGFASVSGLELAGPDKGEGQMAWILWALIDFPIGFIAISYAQYFESNTLAVAFVIAMGGLQWVIWGICITAIVRVLQRRGIRL